MKRSQEQHTHRKEGIYQLAPVISSLVGPELLVVKVTHGSGILLLDRVTAEAALSCREPGPLAAHEQRMSRILAAPPENAARLARALVDGGFLSNCAAVLDVCDPLPESAPAPAISVVGIPTKNRPAAFARAIASYAANAGRWNRAVTFKIVDYSDGACARETRSICRRLKRDGSQAVTYAGARQASRFATRIARAAGVPGRVLRFACGASASARKELATDELSAYGAVRNALLLDTAGSMFISVDDDTECVMAQPESGTDSLILHADPSPYRWSFGNSSDAELKDADFIGRHELALGKPSICWLSWG